MLSDLCIDFYNMTECAYHFEDNLNKNLEISEDPIEVGVFENQYFVEDGHHRIVKKINDEEVENVNFSVIEIEATLIFHNEKPNYLIGENYKYGKIKEWYKNYYAIK